MHKILIVGAGQCGLQLALGLQARDYDVTVTHTRIADRIAAGFDVPGGLTEWFYDPRASRDYLASCGS